MGIPFNSYREEYAGGMDAKSVALQLLEVLADIKRARGVEFAPPSGVAGFSGDEVVDHMERELAKRKFDWRAGAYSSVDFYLQFSVTVDSPAGLNGREMLWVLSPYVEDIGHVKIFAWGCFAQLESMLYERGVKIHA